MKKTIFDPDFFWKNFRLGTELQIAGSFLYNAIFTLENMKTFHYEEECFEFLYHAAVGLERLEKIVVILLEHNDTLSQEQFEKSLITHHHVELLNRIKAKAPLKIGKQHMKFLDMLAGFYNSTRYERYNFKSVYQPPQDQVRLINFISAELKVPIETGLPFSTGVTDNIKKFLGKLIGKLTTQFFEIIQQEANRLHTYTYEIAHNSKAFKIFIAKEFDFTKEKLMQREVALFLLKTLPNDEFKKYINQIEPLPLGQFHTNKYLESMMNFHLDSSVQDEMEYHYEELKLKGDRIESVMLIASSMNFDSAQELPGELSEEDNGI